MNELVIRSLNDLPEKANEFKSLLDNQYSDIHCIAFYGSVGSGKTTIIKAICKEFEVAGNVASPTFAIINEYITLSGRIIYHIDLYRIKNISELLSLGFEEYLANRNLCFIEWPEIASGYLPENTLYIKITVDESDIRILEIERGC